MTLSAIPYLDHHTLNFPCPLEAISHRQGLVAIGGDLSISRLLAAYRLGIFPWFNEGDPIYWWALAPRMILPVEHLHIPRSLQKKIRNTQYEIYLNRDFSAVMQCCANASRQGSTETWINTKMLSAYQELHQHAYAHSFEFWEKEQLCGGLYGVQIGKMFYGESMFTTQADASKIAFVYAVRYLQQQGIQIIDCQMYTDHLARFGAQECPFIDFQRINQHASTQLLHIPSAPQRLYP